jgi:hypothetical protein
MTVNSISDRITYLADGATTQFSFSFSIPSAEAISVQITDPTGVTSELSTGLYNLVINAPSPPNPTPIGGMVIYPLVGPPLAVGNQLTIIRILADVQQTSFSNQGIMYPTAVEQALDYLTMLRQDITGDLSRAFRVGPGDPPPAVVPSVAVRANQAAFFDSAGNLAPGLPPSGGVFISAAMQPVVTATTIPLAQEAMGIPELIAAAIAASGSAFSTGDLKPTHKTVADTGWILWSNGNIGDASSGSTIRANADTQALFTLYYNGYTDAICPVSTSTGAATTRTAQGTATVAFAAHCRMALPLGAGRALGVSGLGAGLTSRVLGSTTGTETRTPSIATMAAHSHPFLDGNGVVITPLSNWGAFGNITFSGPDSISGIAIQNTGGGTPVNVMQPTTFINVMVKL